LRKLLLDRISPFASDDDHLHQLLYRNHAQGKPYLPALLILPLQALLFTGALLFSGTLLWLLLLAFVGVYCFAYFCERKLDTARKSASGFIH